MTRPWLTTHQIAYDRGVWINVRVLSPTEAEAVDGTLFVINEHSIIRRKPKRVRRRRFKNETL